MQQQSQTPFFKKTDSLFAAIFMDELYLLLFFHYKVPLAFDVF